MLAIGPCKTIDFRSIVYLIYDVGNRFIYMHLYNTLWYTTVDIINICFMKFFKNIYNIFRIGFQDFAYHYFIGTLRLEVI